MLGVAFMAGTMVLTQTMEQTFDEVFDAANQGTDVIVRRDAVIEGDLTTACDRFDAGVVDRVAAVEGVASARGSSRESPSSWGRTATRPRMASG